MPELLQPLEGTAQVQYRIALPQQKYLDFKPEQVTFIEATISDSVYSAGRAKHIFQAADPSFVTALRSAMSSANPILLFRLGYGSPDVTYWLPWQEHIVTYHYAKFQGIGGTAGHLVIIESANVLIRMQRQNKVLARKGTVSDIVTAIARENKLKSVVEPTDGQFIMIQNYMDDTRFIAERLTQRAINRQGRAGYYFFLRDNVLHFHTLDYQTSVRQMNFYDTFGGDFEAVDRSQDPTLWDDGVAGVRVVAHDPYTGQAKEFPSDPSKAVKLADNIYQFDKIPNGSDNIFYHLGSNPITEVSAIAQSRYQYARQQTFRAQTVLFKTIALRHGDLLNVLLAQTTKSSDYAGYYYVTSSVHSVKKEAITSVYTLERGEIQAQRGTLSVQDNQNQLTQEAKAPGIKPNIIEIQSSELTKGAGSSSSAKTFSILTDAQTGRTG